MKFIKQTKCSFHIRRTHFGAGLILLFGISANAQSLRLNLNQGLLFHQTQFTNSLGEELEYTPGFTTSNGFTVGVAAENGLAVHLGLSSYSLSTAYTDPSVSTEIELDFLRPSLAAQYFIKGGKVVSPSIALGVGYGMLVKGTQRLENQIVDLVQQDLLGNDLHVWSKIGLNFMATDHLVFGLGYIFQQSVGDAEIQATSQQTQFLFHGFEAQMGIRLE
jgi:hypothetical protein